MSSSNKRERPAFTITYREDGAGYGAAYDHKCFQAITKSSTSCIVPPCMDIKLEEYMSQQTFSFKHEIVMLSESDMREFGGCIVVTGRPSFKILADTNRMVQQYRRDIWNTAQLRNAALRGQPQLVICGGCEPLYYSTDEDLILGIKSSLGEEQQDFDIVKELRKNYLMKVKKHSARKMISMNSEGSVLNNILIHDIKVMESSHLADLMHLPGNSTLKVNSVHKEALRPATEWPEALRQFQVAALSHCDDGSGIGEAIEAIESKHGVLRLAVQWHLEAFVKAEENRVHLREFKRELESHRLVILCLQQAGNAYNKKRKMLRQFNKHLSGVGNINELLSQAVATKGIKSPTDTVLRFDSANEEEVEEEEGVVEEEDPHSHANLVRCFDKTWHSTDAKFAKANNISSSTFSRWRNHDTSPTATEKVISYLRQQRKL